MNKKFENLLVAFIFLLIAIAGIFAIKNTDLSHTADLILEAVGTCISASIFIGITVNTIITWNK